MARTLTSAAPAAPRWWCCEKGRGHLAVVLRCRGTGAWEVTALCAVAEAHLGVEDQRQALRVAREAVALSRERHQEEARSVGPGTAPRQAQALVALLKAQLLAVPEAKELLALWRQLGATWGEAARDLCAQSPAPFTAASEQRWPLVAQLCERLRPQMERQTLEELLKAFEVYRPLPEVEEAWEQLEAGPI